MNNHLKNEALSFDKRLTILLAEDDPDDQDLIRDAFLAANGPFKLHIVSDGVSALQYLSHATDEQLPCLIVLDYNMPVLNGAEVLKKLCREDRFKSIPKLILSTSNASETIQECISSGANVYKVKPSDFPSLVGIAREMMDMCGSAA